MSAAQGLAPTRSSSRPLRPAKLGRLDPKSIRFCTRPSCLRFDQRSRPLPQLSLCFVEKRAFAPGHRWRPWALGPRRLLEGFRRLRPSALGLVPGFSRRLGCSRPRTNPLFLAPPSTSQAWSPRSKVYSFLHSSILPSFRPALAPTFATTIIPRPIRGLYPHPTLAPP